MEKLKAMGVKPKKMHMNGMKAKKAFCMGELVWSCGNIVTYVVDNGISYQEEVDEGASCLSPATFTPSMPGWTFIGWRKDKTASGNVLSSLVMEDNPITLYAVFRKAITITYYNGSTTASSTSGYRYYNTGNVANPSFSLTPTSLSGWTFRGWATSSAAAAGIAYSSISNTAFAASTTVYAAYSQTITLSYNGNGATSGSTAAQTGTRYFNSGNYSNPSFTLKTNGFVKTNNDFNKWALGSASGTQYAAGATVTLSASTTFYAVWTIQTVEITFVEAGTSTKVTYNKGTTVTRSTAPSGATFVGWSTSSNGANPAKTFTASSNMTVYRVVSYENKTYYSDFYVGFDTYVSTYYSIDTKAYPTITISISGYNCTATLQDSNNQQFTYVGGESSRTVNSKTPFAVWIEASEGEARVTVTANGSSSLVA